MQSDRLNINQAAEILGISSGSLRLLIQRRQIRHMRIGPNRGRYWILREWITEYLESCIEHPAEPVESIRLQHSSGRNSLSSGRKRNSYASPATVDFKADLRDLKAKMAKRGGA
jgi:hypothetical protein